MGKNSLPIEPGNTYRLESMGACLSIEIPEDINLSIYNIPHKFRLYKKD